MYDDGEGMGKMASEETMMVMMTTMNAAPMFESETAERMVAENTAAGMPVGGPVAAMDADDDTLTYTLGGTDAASFAIDNMGQIKVGMGTMLDYETRTTYMVTVTATDAAGEMDMVTVTVTVTNVEEAGTVSLDMAQPVTGTAITATLADPDGGVTGTTWQWASSATSDGTFAPITGAMNAAYTPVEGDVGMYLQATASYTDGEGAGKTAMAVSANMVSMAITAPMFDTETAERMVAENTAAGMPVGGPVAAMDADDDTLTYTLGGTDAASFAIDNMGQIKVGMGTMLDYETRTTYMVTVTATDAAGEMDMVTVTVTVTNVEEAGTVSLDMAQPVTGTAITATLADPDGFMDSDVSWQWARTMDDMDSRDMDSWMPITGETNAAYMVTEGDTGYYLRVMATYTDAVGTDMDMEYSMPTLMVVPVGGGDHPLLTRFDYNGNGQIDKSDVVDAINEYLDDVEGISKTDVIDLINYYLDSDS